jgi:putative transcriptional regulator
MDKKTFESIMRGAQQALEYAKGSRDGFVLHHVNVPKKVNVKAIRNRLGMTQHQFALTFGFPERTLKSWEAGERQPESCARVLLAVIAKNPAAVIEATAV